MKIACLIAFLTGLQFASAAEPSETITLKLKNELFQKIVQLEDQKKALEKTLAQMTADLALSQASLAQAGLECRYQMQVCHFTDYMQAQIATIQAQQRADKQKEQNAKAPTTPSYSNPTGVK